MPAGSATGEAPLRRHAWALVLGVVVTWVLAALAVVAGVAPATAPQTRDLPVGEDPAVVLVGIPGLTWDLIGGEDGSGTTDTPTLTSLADSGGSAALVVRGIPQVTCPQDAWLTVGAGERAGAGTQECWPSSGHQGWDGQGALEPDLSRLESLAEAGGTCVATYGLGLQRTDGTLTNTLDEGLTEDLTLEPECRIHLVAAPSVAESDRGGLLPGIDAALGDLVADLPTGSTLVVSGMGQTVDRAQAQVLIVAGPDAREPGSGTAAVTLTSDSTRQRGIVQLADLTPTLLELAGVEPPEVGLTGRSVATVQSAGWATATQDPAGSAGELARGITWSNSLIAWVVCAVAVVILPVLVSSLLLRRHRSARVVLQLAATMALSFPTATFLAGLVPWWNAGQPFVAQTALVLALAAAMAGLAFLIGRRWPSPLAVPAIACALSAVVLGLDVIWSARLGIVSVLGVGPVRAGRFYGQGNPGFGILLGAVLVLMAAAISWMRSRRQAAVAVLVLGGAATVLGAAPQAGADFGSVPALVVGTGLVLISALGLRWTPRLLALLAVTATLVAAVVMVLDWLRPPATRTHLGTFVQAVIDGEAWGIVIRKLEQSLGILVTFPVAWLAVIVLALITVLVIRRPRWSARLWVEPGVRAVGLASVVAMILGWVLNDSGPVTLTMTLTVLIPVAMILLNPVEQPAGTVEASGAPDP